MTARPIVPGRAYNVDGMAIIAVHPASAIIEYLRILSAHGVGLALRLKPPTREINHVQNPQGTAFHAARPAAQAQVQPLATV